MRSQLAVLSIWLCLAAHSAESHALFPGQQTVYTAGDRAIAYFQASHDGKEAQEYRVELFDYDRWTTTRYAVASLEKMTMSAYSSTPGSASIRRFSIMIDLSGEPERTIRVCTKSIPISSLLRPSSTSVNTRVCSKLVARRLR